MFKSLKADSRTSAVEGMKRYLVILAALGTLSSAWARLGDTDDKIEDAYGKVIERHLLDNGTVSVLYGKDRYLYFVVFANGRSVLERYSHVNGTDLSQREIARFLKVNAERASWIADDTSRERRFKRSDQKAEAIYLKGNKRPALIVRVLDKVTH